MRRRRLLRSAALVAVAASGLLVGGCGFRLRGAVRFPFASIHLAATTPLAEELRANLRGSGLQVLGADQPPERAEVVLRLDGEQRGRVIVSRTSAGQIRELQLRLSVRVSARSARGADLLVDTELNQQRDISYSESAALAKEAEEEVVVREMQSELVLQIMRRLATLRPA